ncbi:hypothetical protein [Epilithonimonas sp.]|uniref:exodeoxyribonuclease X C-terminal domain-containing protein n=1 Tax=Epilithonimonas sp. TaxID=2894511 RepID=UPI0035B078C0
MKLELETILDFGKFKGKTIEFILLYEHSYIYWLVNNFDYLEIHPNFVYSATKVNPDFNISELDQPKFKTGVDNFLSYYDSKNKDYEQLSHYVNSGEYLIQPKISTNEIILAKKQIKSFFKRLLVEAKTERIKMQRLEEEKQSEIEGNKLIKEFWNSLENDNFSSEDIDWSKYNEDLGWGEQDQEFWNQF